MWLQLDVWINVISNFTNCQGCQWSPSRNHLAGELFKWQCCELHGESKKRSAPRLHDWWCVSAAPSWEMKTSLGTIFKLIAQTHGIWSRPRQELREPRRHLLDYISQMQMLLCCYMWSCDKVGFPLSHSCFTTGCTNVMGSLNGVSMWDTSWNWEFLVNGFYSYTAQLFWGSSSRIRAARGNLQGELICSEHTKVRKQRFLWTCMSTRA